jgi:hypothetical protein
MSSRSKAKSRALSPRGYERFAHLTKQLQGTLDSRLIGPHTIFTFALCL